MDTKNITILNFITAAILLAAMGCSNAEKGTSKVTVNLGNTAKLSAAKDRTDIISSAVNPQAKQTAPSNLTSLTLKITGSGMEDMVFTYTAGIPSSIQVEVPSGKQRNFTVSAISGTYYYEGNAGADLEANVDATLAVTMGIQYSSVTLVPSFGSSTPPGITSYKVSASVTEAGITIPLVTAQEFTPDTAVQIPTGPKRDIIITAVTLAGDFSGTAALQDIPAGSLSLPVSMAALYTNVAVNPLFPAGTPAVNRNGVFTLTIRAGSSIVVTQEIMPGNSIQVPAGDGKDIEVIANTPSVYFRGTLSNVALTANSSQSIDVNLTLFETKLLIPDLQNNRLVQVENMSGTGWAEKTFSDFVDPVALPSYGFGPYSFDFDSLGRIYLALRPSDYNVCIIMFNNINDTAFTQVGSCFSGPPLWQSTGKKISFTTKTLIMMISIRLIPMERTRYC